MANDRNGLEYKIYSYVGSDVTDVPRWLQLQFRLNGKYFRIVISKRKFIDSPNRLVEFERHFTNVSELAQDEGTVAADNEDSDIDGNLGKAPHEITQFFQWIVDPFLSTFREIAPLPLPDSTLTLHDRYICESFECLCEARDDSLVLGPITHCEDGHESYLHEDFSPRNDAFLMRDDPRFLVFKPSDVDIIGDPRRMIEDDIKKVRASGKDYTFKCVENISNSVTNLEMARYTQIEDAKFAPELHISRLAGVVSDDRRGGHPRLLGLLLHYIDEADRLKHFIFQRMGMSSDRRLQTIAQLCESVRALHSKDIVWGDAHYDCVIVDKENNSWLMDFGSGLKIKGYIHDSVMNTEEGDLEGLGNIMQLLMPESDW